MLVAASAVPVGADAQIADRSAGAITITGSSERPWEMICHVLAGGEESPLILNNGRPAYSGKNIRRISCDFKRSSKAALVVTIVAPGMKCPLKTDDTSQCTRSFDKNTAGSFVLGGR